MNPFGYIESRWTKLNTIQKQYASPELAHRDAVMAIMWLVIKATTAAYLLWELALYLGVCLRIVSRPPSAREIAANFQRDTQAKKANDAKLVDGVVKDLLTNGKAKSLDDELPTKGNA